MTHLFPDSDSYLGLADSTLVLLALIGVAGFVASLGFGLRRGGGGGVFLTATGLILTLGSLALTLFLAPPAFNFKGEREYGEAQRVAAKCGANLQDYSDWLRGEVLKDEALAPGESVTLTGTTGTLTGRYGSKGHRVTCAPEEEVSTSVAERAVKVKKDRAYRKDGKS